MFVDFQICISVSFLAYRHHHYVGLDFDIITSWKIYKEAKKQSKVIYLLLIILIVLTIFDNYWNCKTVTKGKTNF